MSPLLSPLLSPPAQWGLPSFGQPGWLWALGALAIPLLLHLLSRGQRHRVQVGSVRLLSEVASRHIRRIHPTRLLLLVVRCLLLAAVAVTLAGPLSPATTPEPDETWLLVDPALLAARSTVGTHATPSEAVAAFARLDQAAATGLPIRLLAPDLPVFEGKTTLAPPPIPSSTDLWSFLREADHLAHPATRFEVLALDRLSALRGQRPALVRSVEWQAVALSSIPVSADAGVAPPTPGPSRPRATPLHALVAYTSERSADAGFVIAALESADLAREKRTGSTLTLERRLLPDSPELPRRGAVDRSAHHQQTDLAFWLGRAPSAEALRVALRPGGQLITDSLLPYQRCQRLATIHLASDSPTLRLHRCEAAEGGTTASDGGEFAALWSDAHGRVLIATTRTTSTHPHNRLHLHSRFHPAWSDWVTRDSFPRWIAEVVDSIDPAAESAARVEVDDRPAPGQPSPRHVLPLADPNERRSEPIENERSLPPLWAAIALLLVAERWIALR